ncbi:ABC transporter A family member 6-like [Planococcus citri]|uniref:ABC transporter A family member 6-like n=1 Tax=Planococcus citri TaxID=170843 RepID=UPI0031FA21E7
MKMLEMRGKENSKANTLTISSRRKLSFAIALLKKPKILILDEATFGMDFISKRRAWSMLKNLRKDHTIILSTGYAKEAARLADRVAILQNGTVVTHGTPAYLENTFGTGYELIITIEKNTNHVPLLELVKKVISDALVTQQKYNVIAFKIPPAEIIKFVQVFKELEQNKKSLGIINMEVAYATLEQILSKIQNEFLETPKRLSKIIHDKITPKNRSNDQNVTYSTNLPSAKPSPTLGDSNFQVEKGFSLKVQQMRVLLEVKILYTKRSYLNVIVKRYNGLIQGHNQINASSTFQLGYYKDEEMGTESLEKITFFYTRHVDKNNTNQHLFKYAVEIPNKKHIVENRERK